MPNQNSQHRHFIAAPLAMAFMVVVAGTSTALQGSAIDTGVMNVRLSAESEPQPFAVGWTVSGLLQPQSSLLSDANGTSVRLVKGQALLRSAADLRIQLGRTVTVHALRAALFIADDQSSMTVAALDAPVIVDDGSSMRVVPPGRQWMFRDGKAIIARLPADWQRHQMSELATLADVELPVVDSDAADSAESRRLLLAHSLTSTFALTAQDSEREFALVASLDPAFKNLVLIHQMLRSARIDDAFAATIADSIAADPVLRKDLAILLPAVALRGIPLKQIFIDAWPDRIVGLGLSDEPAARAELDAASVLPERMEDRGYPLQAEYWRSAVLRAAAVLHSVVPADQRAIYGDIIARASTPDELRSAAGTSSSAASLAPLTNWSDEELTAVARAALVSNGALLASTTTFTADEATQTVRIDGAYVAEDSRDVSYAFTFDPSRQVLTNIVRDGKRLPNSVPVQTFFASH